MKRCKTVAEAVKKIGVTEQNYYRWKKRFAGVGTTELRRLRILEKENKNLRQLVACLSLDKKILHAAPECVNEFETSAKRIQCRGVVQVCEWVVDFREG
jgi:putative transposase